MLCDSCYSLLKSWSDALNEYAFRVRELKYTDPRHYARFYDEAASAFELTAKAKALYDAHREEHAIGVGLKNLSGAAFTAFKEFHDERNQEPGI